MPRTAVSGGKPLRGKKPNGTGLTRVAGMLRMAAASLRRSDTAIGARFRRIARRKGFPVAVLFVLTRKLATLVYRALRYGQEYVDIGSESYEQHYREQPVSNLKMDAAALGYSLTPQPQQPQQLRQHSEPPVQRFVSRHQLLGQVVRASHQLRPLLVRTDKEG